MPWGVQNFHIEFAHLEMLAILKEVIEVPAVRDQIGGIENRSKDSLNIPDMLADPYFRAGLRLDVGRPGTRRQFPPLARTQEISGAYHLPLSRLHEVRLAVEQAKSVIFHRKSGVAGYVLFRSVT